MGNPVDFSNVVFQSNFEGTDGSTPTTGLDDSDFDHTTSFVSDAIISTDANDTRFGSSGLATPTFGDTLLINQQGSEFAIGTNDFTIEGFFRRDGSQTNDWIFSHYHTGGNDRAWAFIQDGSTTWRFVLSANGTSTFPIDFTGMSFPNDNVFHHLMVTRDGTTISAYTDGVRQATATDSTNVHAPDTNDELQISGLDGTGSSTNQWRGAADAVRFCIGEALYDPTQTNITVPTDYFSGAVIPAAGARVSQLPVYAGVNTANPETRVSQLVAYAAAKVSAPIQTSQLLAYAGFSAMPDLRVSQLAAYVGTPNALAPCVSQRATCWRITRTDGTVFRFTSHDKDVDIGAETFSPCDSLSRSALEISAEIGTVDNIDISGVISDSSITQGDLFAGAFDGATVEVLEVDWTPSPVQSRTLAVGTAGRLQQGDSGYKFEVITESQKLQNKGLLQQVTPTCRWVLGSSNVAGSPGCGVDLEALRVSGSVTAVGSRTTFRQLPKRTFVDSTRTEADDYFKLGLLTWTAGSNSGLTGEIKDYTSKQFTLWQEFPNDIREGDTYTVVPGCNKIFDGDCLTKFNNRESFGGFPHLPGRDFLLKRGDR